MRRFLAVSIDLLPEAVALLGLEKVVGLRVATGDRGRADWRLRHRLPRGRSVCSSLHRHRRSPAPCCDWCRCLRSCWRRTARHAVLLITLMAIGAFCRFVSHLVAVTTIVSRVAPASGTTPSGPSAAGACANAGTAKQGCEGAASQQCRASKAIYIHDKETPFQTANPLRGATMSRSQQPRCKSKTYLKRNFHSHVIFATS